MPSMRSIVAHHHEESPNPPSRGRADEACADSKNALEECRKTHDLRSSAASSEAKRSNSLFAPPSAQQRHDVDCHSREKRDPEKGWFKMISARFPIESDISASEKGRRNGVDQRSA